MERIFYYILVTLLFQDQQKAFQGALESPWNQF